MTGLEDSVLLGSRELITVIGNLVDNAFDSVAGPRNGDAHVELRMSRVADTLELSVTDNGPGFSPAVRSSMFDEGFTTKETGVHAGIGLSLVRDSVATLGGSIHVAQEEGAVFSVSVPDAFEAARSVAS